MSKQVMSKQAISSEKQKIKTKHFWAKEIVWNREHSSFEHIQHWFQSPVQHLALQSCIRL